jgi:hypothetical protein
MGGFAMPMRSTTISVLLALAASAILIPAYAQMAVNKNGTPASEVGLLTGGKQIFRFDTLGDEQLWTDTLRMHEVVKDLTPRTALSVGLKVDSDALPQELIDLIKAGDLDLDDPANTIALLKLNAVIGVIGRVGPGDRLTSIGITCALCHSTVDNRIIPGIGRRLDGWANRSLNVGAIVALSPAVTDKAPFESWGPGKFDPRFQIFDGTRLIRRHSSTLPAVIPSIFGLQGVGFETFTGDGPISYWNNYVGVTQMGGQGSFRDPRIGVNVRQEPDLVRPKLLPLLAYQLSLLTPPPPRGSFNRDAAERGERLFNGAARCATCHRPPLLTDVRRFPWSFVPFLHSPSEVGQEPVYARRSATKRYRTTPLRALWQHPPYFHDGSAADLPAVVDHYNSLFHLRLTDRHKHDLVEYLKTL